MKGGICCSIMVLVAVAGCARQEKPAPPVESAWPAMGSFASVSLPREQAERLAEAAEITATIVKAIEDDLSNFNPASTVGRINRLAGSTESTELTRHSRAVFDLTSDAWKSSGGAFDPTVGPFMRVWGFRDSKAPAAVPATAELKQAAELVGWNKVRENNDRVSLPLVGMSLDFGGIAKGYAVDEACELMLAAGFDSFLVNMAGNMRAFGAARRQRTGWVIAVRDPYLSYGEGHIGTLCLTDGQATSTSGRYERFVEIGGERYAHIIDPHSGQPVGGMAQVTVTAASAAEADACSTALFIMGSDKGSEMLRARADLEALFVLDPVGDKDVQVLATPGFLKNFEVAPEWKSRIEVLASGN